MERIRHQISFRLEDAQHQKALEYLRQHTHRSDYIVACILKAEEQDFFLSAIQDTIRASLSTVQTVDMGKPDASLLLDCPMPESGELNPDLLHFMEEL